jgi:1-acyl-sn-glycerol-3-phosphate acyltransferase
MSVSPVGDGHVDAKPWRRGPLVRAITDRAASISSLPKPKLPARMQGFPYRAPAMPGNAEPLEVESELGVNYDTEWARGPGARVTRRAIQAAVLTPTLRALTAPDIRGLDRLEALSGPVIFVANHHSHLDTGLLLSSLPYRFRKRAIVAAAADYFFDKRVKATVSALVLNAVPIAIPPISYWPCCAATGA